MENEHTKCPNCYGLRCDPVMDFFDDRFIRICDKYFQFTNCSCIAICPVCNGKGYLDWIELLFKPLDDDRLKEAFEFFKDKKDYNWYVANRKTICEDLDRKIVEQFYKDMYGE